jgi:hypothetical protein
MAFGHDIAAWADAEVLGRRFAADEAMSGADFGASSKASRRICPSRKI